MVFVPGAMEPRVLRAIGLLSIVACAVGVLYSPFHAAAYLATQEGSDPPLVPWTDAFSAMAGGALDFGSADEVYLAYGKLAWIGVAGMLGAAVVLHQRQARAAVRTERVGFWILIGGLALLTGGSLGEYYTPFLDESFMFLSAPGMLLTLVGHVVFGLGTRKAAVAPKAAAWVFILAPAIVIAMIALFGHIPLALAPVLVAWIVTVALTA